MNAKIGKVRKACADIKFRQRNMRRLLADSSLAHRKQQIPPEHSQNNSSYWGYEILAFSNLQIEMNGKI
jgi:hypothetical protein